MNMVKSRGYGASYGCRIFKVENLPVNQVNQGYAHRVFGYQDGATIVVDQFKGFDDEFGSEASQYLEFFFILGNQFR